MCIRRQTGWNYSNSLAPSEDKRELNVLDRSCENLRDTVPTENDVFRCPLFYEPIKTTRRVDLQRWSKGSQSNVKNVETKIKEEQLRMIKFQSLPRLEIGKFFDAYSGSRKYPNDFCEISLKLVVDTSKKSLLWLYW